MAFSGCCLEANTNIKLHLQSVALSVYQTILGGSLQGHTDYSKLSKHVLSNPAVGSAMGFNHQYSDAGLFGVYGSCIPAHAPEYVKAVHQAMADPITADDITRAKNTLKRVASESTSSAPELVEDIGKQMSMCGNALSPEQIAVKIDAVTDAQVKGCQMQMQMCKPTVVGYGNVAYVPHYDEICEVFKGGPAAIPAAAIPAAQKKVETPKPKLASKK